MKYMKKITSVKKVNSPDFKIKIGTFDKKCPESVFIIGNTYIIPDSDEGYVESVEGIERGFKKILRDRLYRNDWFDNTFIEIVDTPTERMRAGKRSYITFECHLKNKNGYDFKKISEYLSDKCPGLFCEVKDCISKEGFSVVKTR